jgi:hypothetical protein
MNIVLLTFEFEFIHYVSFEHACIGNNENFVYIFLEMYILFINKSSLI